MDDSPVTVFLPNYNHARYLPESLGSLAAQTRPPSEIIIIDDASTDGSAAILEEFASRHSSVRFLRNETNQGVVANENRAVRMAQGRYFFGLSADDRVAPEFLEKSLALLNRHPEAALCSTPSYRIDEDGRNLGLYPTPVISSQACYLSPEQVLATLRRRGSWFMGNATIWNRQSLLDLGDRPEDLDFFHDGFLSQVLGLKQGVCYLPEPLADFRQVPGQKCEAGADLAAALPVYERAMELMRTTYRDLFPDDYIESFRRRTWANTIEASMDRAVRRHFDQMRSRSSGGLRDRLFLLCARLFAKLHVCSAKLFLATLRHGYGGAIRRAFEKGLSLFRRRR
ncbi:MAG: glycosyltransferase family 2 protein [Planctomycetaceae bacterium]